MHPGAPARVQACHKACPLPQASYRVCRYPQGGVLQVQDEPKKGPEAGYQEVVLRAYCRVWLGRIGGSRIRLQYDQICQSNINGRNLKLLLANLNMIEQNSIQNLVCCF